MIGIGNPDEPIFGDVLDALAIAGGRPQEGPRAYYDIQSPVDLDEALNELTSGVTLCVYRLPSYEAGAEILEVRVGGAFIPRDSTRREGWELTDARVGEISFFGLACDAAANPRNAVEVTVACTE